MKTTALGSNLINSIASVLNALRQGSPALLSKPGKAFENHPDRRSPATPGKNDGEASGLLIECQSGQWWLTQHGCAADILLGPGQSVVVAHGGLVVVEPLTGIARVLGRNASPPATPLTSAAESWRFYQVELARNGAWNDGVLLALWLCGLASLAISLFLWTRF